MRLNRVRAKLENNEPALGPNVQIPAPWLVEIIGVAGFDYVMLDGEHGAAFSNLQVLIIAADAAGITPIVRVPSHDRGYILPALEAGAGGIQVPMVETVEQARRLVAETKYAPIGQRGFSNATRAANYGTASLSTYGPLANHETLLILQIETQAGLDNVAEIAKVAGVDALFFGPGDLSQALGLFGQQAAPQVRAAILQAIEAANQNQTGGPYISTSAFSKEDVAFWHSHGVQMFLTSSIHPIREAFEKLHATMLQAFETP